MRVVFHCGGQKRDYLVGMAIQKGHLSFRQNVWGRSNDRHMGNEIKGKNSSNYKLHGEKTKTKSYKRKEL